MSGQMTKINMGDFPSGQRGQTVNLLATPSVVRIHHRPSYLLCRSGGTGRRPGLKIPWVVIPVPVRFRSAAFFYSKFLLGLEYFFILYQICTDFSHQKTVPIQEPFRIKPTLFSYFLFFLILFILNTNSLDCYTPSSYYFDIFKVL